MHYHAPESIEAAVSALSAGGADSAILAGGTDLLVQLRTGRAKPLHIVDLKKIKRLRAITVEPDAICIGAAVSGAELNEREDIKREWPGVLEAFDLIGSTQIQGRATLGGNLCNASPAADSVPALIAAGAVCIIAGADGMREAPIESITTAPGKTTLRNNELIVEFRLPRRQSRSGDAYLRLIPRTEMDIAVVGVGVNISLDEAGNCSFARVGLGAVAPTALLVEIAANALVGTPLDAAAIEQGMNAIRAACSPIDDKRGTVDYRIEVAGVLFQRAVGIAFHRAGAPA